MSRRSLVRRFAPLAVLIAAQLLIIAAVPSKAPDEQAISTGGGVEGPAFGAGPTSTLAGGDPTATTVADDDGDPATVNTGGPRTGGGGGGPAGGGDTGDAGGPGGPAGDTSHCVNGRQFDPSFYFYAPPCVPKFEGNNGGATYRGVTADTIKVIYYDEFLGAAVDAILKAQGSDPSDEQLAAVVAAAEKTINERYEFYGRKLDIEVWKGRCSSVPPDYPCLRNEMRQIVAEKQPFAFVDNSSLASPKYDEMSKLGVLNVGGWSFRDSFNQNLRPYHWDLFMGGSQLTAKVGEWYCKRMAGGTADYAGEQGTQKGKPRVLGILSQDDPENKLAAGEFKEHLKKCGVTVQHEYYYAQDITTADQQRRAAVAEMRKPPEATTLACFCDGVAPIFLYNTAEEQRYYPEHVIVGTGNMDADETAQAYDHTLPPDDQLGAHQFENAFGLAQYPDQEPRESNAAARMWKAAGNQGTPAYGSAVRDFDYLNLFATLAQAAGPILTPENVEKGAFALGPVGDPSNEKIGVRSFGPGDYTWRDTLREVYWSPTKTSEFNGEPGTWISMNGGRWFQLGEFPTGLIKLPPKPR